MYLFIGAFKCEKHPAPVGIPITLSNIFLRQRALKFVPLKLHCRRRSERARVPQESRGNEALKLNTQTIFFLIDEPRGTWPLSNIALQVYVMFAGSRDHSSSGDIETRQFTAIEWFRKRLPGSLEVQFFSNALLLDSCSIVAR